MSASTISTQQWWIQGRGPPYFWAWLIFFLRPKLRFRAIFGSLMRLKMWTFLSNKWDFKPQGGACEGHDPMPNKGCLEVDVRQKVMLFNIYIYIYIYLFIYRFSKGLIGMIMRQY